jgi:hypothetical protein
MNAHALQHNGAAFWVWSLHKISVLHCRVLLGFLPLASRCSSSWLSYCCWYNPTTSSCAVSWCLWLLHVVHSLNYQAIASRYTSSIDCCMLFILNYQATASRYTSSIDISKHYDCWKQINVSITDHRSRWYQASYMYVVWRSCIFLVARSHSKNCFKKTSVR